MGLVTDAKLPVPVAHWPGGDSSAAWRSYRTLEGASRPGSSPDNVAHSSCLLVTSERHPGGIEQKYACVVGV